GPALLIHKAEHPSRCNAMSTASEPPRRPSVASNLAPPPTGICQGGCSIQHVHERRARAHLRGGTPHIPIPKPRDLARIIQATEPDLPPPGEVEGGEGRWGSSLCRRLLSSPWRIALPVTRHDATDRVNRVDDLG